MVCFFSADPEEENPAGEREENADPGREPGYATGREPYLEEGDAILSEDDPFLESDLPLSSLADRETGDPES